MGLEVQDIEMEEDEISRLQALENSANSNLINTNRFSPLSDNEEDWKDVKNNPKRRKQNSNNTTVQPKNPSKPPPLVILHTNAKQLQTEVSALGVKDFTMRMTSESTRIFFNNNEDYAKVKKNFIENKKAFFTHSLKEDQLSKFVLSGLHKMTDDEVKQAVSQAGKTPTLVKTMRTRVQNTNHALYLIFFLKKDKVKLRDLQEISVVNYMRVRWSNYENKRAGPSQCANCQRFGHGSTHCHANPRCIRCAENHASKDCPLIKGPNGESLKRIDTALLVCVQCGLQHAANFSNCRKRIEFIKSRQTVTSKTKQGHLTKSANKFRFENALQLNEVNFPNIPSQSSSKPAWSHATSQPLPQSQPQRAPRVQDPKVSGEKSLPMNIDEMFSVYSEMVEILTVARTRQDQISALMKLALKFVAPLYV
jgi:arsenate reductase-like glutaredoxin family protein